MDDLERKVAQFVRQHRLFAGGARILLAVSGGADSTALLHALQSLRIHGDLDTVLVCAHINHQLRGPASDADERFVIAQANRLGLPVVTRTVDVRAYARTHGLSLETAGREVRLAQLGQIARDHRCAWVATGHQKNDNAETVLHRLWRGTGFRGLAGIRPVRRIGDLQLVSPLLCATRHEIVQYLQARALPWREDQTNVEVAYTRNYIRHRLLPSLQEQAQGCLIQELSELAASAAKLYEHLEREAEEAWSGLAEPGAADVVFRAPELAALPEPVAVELIRRAIVRLATGKSDLAEPHYRGILQLARKRPDGKSISLPGGLLARYEQERLTLSRDRVREAEMVRDTHPAVLAIPGRTRFAGQEIEAKILPCGAVDATSIRGDKGGFVEYLDFDRVKLPVIVRTRHAGDRFQPLGMVAEKKVGKFLTTAKAPRDLRERILIFADRERIIWVCPARLSEPVKVTEGTRRVLQLTVGDGA